VQSPSAFAAARADRRALATDAARFRDREMVFANGA
jgi:hypothetical protein